MTEKRWSKMSPQELLDEAQMLFDDVKRKSPNANGLHGDLIRAQALVTAAHVQALCRHKGAAA